MTSPIWISGIIVLVVLSVIVRQRKLSATYPWFTTYVYFSAMAWVIGAVCLIHSPMAYWYFYCAHEILVDLVTVRVFYELWRNVFGPWRAIPKDAPIQMAKRLGASVIMTAALAITLSLTHSFGLLQMISRVELIFDAFVLLAVWAIALYSRVLGITWPVIPHNIATGFVAFLTVDILSILFRSHLGPGTPMLVRASASITYVFTLAIWSWNLRKKEPAPAELTAEDLFSMAASMTDWKGSLLNYGLRTAGQNISFETR